MDVCGFLLRDDLVVIFLYSRMYETVMCYTHELGSTAPPPRGLGDSNVSIDGSGLL